MRAPAPLSTAHDIAGFDCGNETMNEWLKNRALKNQEDRSTRTFVVCADSGPVAAYYALAVGACERDDAPGSVSRRMPDPIPMMILARLAVDKTLQGRGLARQLIADAVLRTLAVAENAGVRGLLVSAIDDRAAAYYERLGFIRAKRSENVLMIRLKVARDVLAGNS